jgi:phosphohistidine phosphatase
LRVTLIRHGTAVDTAPRDEERALTRGGRADVRRVGRALDRRKIRFDAIVSSPLVRAVQTAEIIAAAVGYGREVIVERALTPAAAPRGAIDLVHALRGRPRILLVAHEPILSAVASLLLGRRFRPLAKAEAVRIRLDDGPQKPGVFRWSMSPDKGKLRRAP